MEYLSEKWLRDNNWGCLAGPYDETKRWEVRKLNSAIRQLGSIEYRLSKNGKNIYLWRQGMKYD